jgi:hypothetical protein
MFDMNKISVVLHNDGTANVKFSVCEIDNVKLPFKWDLNGENITIDINGKVSRSKIISE